MGQGDAGGSCPGQQHGDVVERCQAGAVKEGQFRQVDLDGQAADELALTGEDQTGGGQQRRAREVQLAYQTQP